jgi:hypothetical protein
MLASSAACRTYISSWLRTYCASTRNLNGNLGCHCRNWNYSESYTWPGIGTSWTQADKIGNVGAWDARTGTFLPALNPWTRHTHNPGAWDIFEDSTGTAWLLGDYDQARRTDGLFQWQGGFVRHAPRDTTAPKPPSALTSTSPAPGTSRLRWSPAAVNRGNIHYEIIRDDRVIATTTDTSHDVATPAQPRR